MQLNALNAYFHYFADQQMNFLYTGNFSDEHTDGFIELNNHQYNAANEYKKLQRRAGFLIAECFQNIVRHNDPKNKDSFFQIRNDQGQFQIVSANRVQNNIITQLKAQLTQLNKLTSSELKAAYRETLSSGEFSEKGGAGLGFIEMARRSNNALSFDFSKIDAVDAYFYFGLHLNLIKEEKESIQIDFQESKMLRSKMQQDDLFFVYKGIVSIQTTIVILSIIDHSLETAHQKVVFVKFMGLFEKLSRLSDTSLGENACMLLIGENEEEYSVAASCFLKQNEARRLDRIMKMYQQFDNSALDKEYKRVLSSHRDMPLNEPDLDLIEILKSSSNFEFKVQSHDEANSHLSLILKFKKKAPSKIQFNAAEKKTEPSKGIQRNQASIK